MSAAKGVGQSFVCNKCFDTPLRRPGETRIFLIVMNELWNRRGC